MPSSINGAIRNPPHRSANEAAGHLSDYRGLLDNSWGDLPIDRRHSFRAFGSYAFDMGPSLGGHLYYETGRPISGPGIRPTDEWAAMHRVASLLCAGRASATRLVRQYGQRLVLDLMLAHTAVVGPGELNLRVDVFKVFNNHGVTEVDELGDLPSGAPNPDFLAPDRYQAPRRIRLGVGWVF